MKEMLKKIEGMNKTIVEISNKIVILEAENNTKDKPTEVPHAAAPFNEDPVVSNDSADHLTSEPSVPDDVSFASIEEFIPDLPTPKASQTQNLNLEDPTIQLL